MSSSLVASAQEHREEKKAHCTEVMQWCTVHIGCYCTQRCGTSCLVCQLAQSPAGPLLRGMHAMGQPGGKTCISSQDAGTALKLRSTKEPDMSLGKASVVSLQPAITLTIATTITRTRNSNSRNDKSNRVIAILLAIITTVTTLNN